MCMHHYNIKEKVLSALTELETIYNGSSEDRETIVPEKQLCGSGRMEA